MSSRFFSATTAHIDPYVPGEQPPGGGWIKLNTNECPYPPSPAVAAALRDFDTARLRLYPDPDSRELTAALAAAKGLEPRQALVTGGSDEALALAFLAFFDRGARVAFPDITYGFYQVYADLFGLAARPIPLAEDFTVDLRDYAGLAGNLFLANPNAPTGIALQPGDIERILRLNRDRLVVVDEAYIDFAPGLSCIDLVNRYDNLLVIQTFSKSRALAGMRLGAAFGQAPLIDGLTRIKYSLNPYNLDQVSQAVGLAATGDDAYLAETTGKVIATRERVRRALEGLRCTVLPSRANFLFVRHATLSGAELCRRLREAGILVRHFPRERISEYVRVTIGTDNDMDKFLQEVSKWQWEPRISDATPPKPKSPRA